MKNMYDVETLGQKIRNGAKFLLAGDESLLKMLPKGNWIGGSIPYFVSENGGEISRKMVFATEIPNEVVDSEPKTYTKATLENIYVDGPANGFTVLIVPASSPSHLEFSLKAPGYKNFAVRPLVGWISGVHLEDLGKVAPVVFNGQTGEAIRDGAVAMHVTLPKDKYAEIGTINIFEQSQGDSITFEEDSFAFSSALVNGKKVNFYDYVKDRGLDLKLPLVADYYGMMVNSSFQSLDEASKRVNFYAPLFRGITYRQAKPFQNYVNQFKEQIPEDAGSIAFSCNCILNFLYAELEGKKTGAITGPITFGEIAYQLLNQTMVYLTIHNA